jgi:protein-S-isoprenylcysteine O-methyltransferase Ste14
VNAEAIVTVSAAVVALTQIAKWSHLVEDNHGPLVVLALAVVGVVAWGVSNEAGFSRALIWPYFAGWVAVSTSAAGVYGFTRAFPDAITSTSNPPTGAAQEHTAKI